MNPSIYVVFIMLSLFGYVYSVCPSAYPNVCWQNLDFTTATQPDGIPRRIRHTMEYYGDGVLTIHVFGGMNPATNQLHNDVWRIVATPPVPSSGIDTWTVSSITRRNSDPPASLRARMDHVMVYFRRADNRPALYIHGGVGDIRLKDIWRYNVDENTWSEMGEPQAGQGNVARLFGHTAIMVNDPLTNGLDASLGRVWIYGGTDATNAIRNQLHIYTPPNNVGSSGSNAWVVTAHTSFTTTQHCAAIVHEMCMYIYGGVSSYAPFTVTRSIAEYCEEYPNPADDTVQTRPLGFTTYDASHSGVTPVGRLNRFAHTCTKADDRMLIFGGRPNIAQPNFSNDMLDYDPVLNMFGSVSMGIMFANDPGTRPGGREEHAAIGFTLFGDYYHVIFGGRGSSTNFNDMWAINYKRPRCEAGFFAEFGTIDCQPCAPGSISPEASYTCTNCTAGEYTNMEGDSECRQCPPGTYTLLYPVGNITECTPCPIGTYSNVWGRDSLCIDCPAGTYSNNETGLAECYQCPGGTFSDVLGAFDDSVCKNCTRGFYSPPGSSQCFQCPGGTYSAEDQQEECDICDAGTWSDPQSVNCTNCEVGTSNNAPGSEGIGSCQPCPAGTYAPEEATPYCIHCRPGTYSTVVGAITNETCLECPIGTYNNESAGPSIDACRPCPAGTYQNITGSPWCAECPPGYWNDQIESIGIEDCLACPAGTHSPVWGTPALEECIDCDIGEYQPIAGSSFCRLCPNGTYNPETRGSTLSSCRKCPPDSFSIEGQSSCVSCPGSTQTIIQNSSITEYTLESFSFPGWERCQSCSEEISYGWVKNGHFEDNPVHGFWHEYENTGCNIQFVDGVLRMDSVDSESQCSMRQIFTSESISTFPYVMVASSRSDIVSSGTNATYQARFVVTLKNGTTEEHILSFNDDINWNEEKLEFRPRQVSTRSLLDHLYIIDYVTIYLEFHQIEGFAEWDDVKFSPLSKNMCNCSRIQRESEKFTIDLFQRDSCDLCTVGRYCNGGGEFQCFGNTYSFGGYTFCLPCRRGLACLDGIATTCGPTQFTNDTSGLCQDCPSDSGCRNTERHICSPGTYGQGKRHCVPCQPGTFCNSYGCTSCEICPPGQTSNFQRTSCFGCPIGQYANEDGLCRSCPLGTYTNSTGSAECFPCPDGQTTTCIAAKGIEFCS